MRKTVFFFTKIDGSFKIRVFFQYFNLLRCAHLTETLIFFFKTGFDNILKHLCYYVCAILWLSLLIICFPFKRQYNTFSLVTLCVYMFWKIDNKIIFFNRLWKTVSRELVEIIETNRPYCSKLYGNK